MMEGQADEKADVAVKSSRTFCPNKSNMHYVDKKGRQFTFKVATKGSFFSDLRYFEINKILHL